MRKSRKSPVKKDTSLVVSMFTHKGGVGKTTATWSFAAQLAELGANTLLVDADPQGNLTKSFILFKISLEYPHLRDDERQVIASKVARVFLLKAGKDQLSNTDGMNLVFISDNKCYSHAEITAAYAGQLDGGFVVLYPYEFTEADHAENSRFEVGARVWYLHGKAKDGAVKTSFFCGKDKEGREFGNDFDGLSALLEVTGDKDLDREDVVFADASRLTQGESKRILSRAALLLDREDYVVADIVDDFLNTRLTLIEDIDTLDETQYEPGEFLLAYSKEEQVWKLCHYVKSDLDECPVLHDRISLGAILNPAEIKSTKDITEALKRKVIRAINQYYRAINFTEAFNFRFFDTESSAEKVQDHIDQLALLEIDLRKVQHQIPVLSKLPPEQLGTIRLLAGNYNILLHLGRDLSSAAHSMSKGGGLEKYESNITLIHEFTRRVSRMIADVTLIDMSPSANDLNSSLLMTGDYVISASSPANYSNDAMESLVEILAAWREDYRRLYAESHGRYVPITAPPKLLGYFLNKSSIRDNKLDKPRAGIAEEIEAIFRESLLPLAVELGMYPAFGLPGYQVVAPAPGQPEAPPQISGPPKVGTGIPSCKGYQEAKVNKEGVPLIWTQDPTPLRSAVARVFGKTIGMALSHDPRVREAVKLASEQLRTTNLETEVGAFQKTWSRAYAEQAGSLGLKKRKGLINTLGYRLDYIDMFLLAQSMRHAIHQEMMPQKLGFDEGSSMGFDNGEHVLLVDPCLEKQIKATLTAALKQVQDHKNPSHLKCIVIPFFAGYWQCVRIEVSYVHPKDKPKETIGKLHFLFDDPHGGVFEFQNEGMPRRQRGKQNEISNELRTSVLRQCITALNEGHPIRLMRRNAPKFRRVVVQAKSIDQQGYPYNDGHDSGIITLNNAYDYCVLPISNNEFDPSADEHRISCGFSESESTVVFGDIRDIPSSRDKSSKQHQYRLKSDQQERKLDDPSDKITKSSLRAYVVKKYFDKHGGHYAKLMLTKGQTLHAINKACLKVYREYLFVELGRIQDAYLQAANDILNASPHPLTISRMVTLLYQKCMKGLQFKQGREKPYGEGEHFSATQTGLAMSILAGKSNRKSMLSPGAGKAENVTFLDSSSSSSGDSSDGGLDDDSMSIDSKELVACKPAEHQAFIDRWTQRYADYTRQQSMQRRADNVAHKGYRYDLVDMMLLLRVLRFKINTHRLNKRRDTPSFAEASLPAYHNVNGDYILDPCRFEDIGDHLKSNVELLLHGWKAEHKRQTISKHVIVPFFKEYWQCIRLKLHIFISSKTKGVVVTYDCLVDDPHGLYSDAPPKPGKTYNAHDPNLDTLYSDEFLDALESQIEDVMRTTDFRSCFGGLLKGDVSCTYLEDKSVTQFKAADQMGYLYSDNVDSGPVILRNIEDYCTTRSDNERYSSCDAGECRVVSKKDTGYTLKAHYMPRDGEELPRWMKVQFANPEAYFQQRTYLGHVRTEHKEWLSTYRKFLDDTHADPKKVQGRKCGLTDYLEHFRKTLERLDGRFINALDQLLENRYKPNASSGLDISVLVHALYFEYFNGARRGAGNTQELIDALSADDFVFPEAVCQRAYARLSRLKVTRYKKKASKKKKPVPRGFSLFGASLGGAAGSAGTGAGSSLGVQVVQQHDFLGLEFQPVPRDGHCLFHAVGLFLGQDHEQLRFTVADELEFRARAEWRVQMEAEQGSVAAYVKKIRETEEWGDHLEVSVLQHIYKRPVIVIRPDQTLQLPDPAILALGDPIFIFYNGHNHYDGFTLKPGEDNGAAVLAKIQSLLAQSRPVTFDPYAAPQARSGKFARARTAGPDPKRKELSRGDASGSDHDEFDIDSSARDKRRKLQKQKGAPKLGIFKSKSGQPKEKRQPEKRKADAGNEGRSVSVKFTLNPGGPGSRGGSSKGGSPAQGARR